VTGPAETPAWIRSRPPLPLAMLAFAALVFLALPLAGLALRAPWAQLPAQLASPAVRSALYLSLVASLMATALACVLGFPLAWLFARAQLPGLALLRGLATLPLVLPPVVGGVALLLAFGRLGILGRWLDSALGLTLFGTTAAVVLAETFIALPFVVISVEAALRAMDRRYEDASATLGATKWTTLRRVTLPLIAPGVGAGALLAWARALGEFGATITFAGNLPGATRTMPVAVFTELQKEVDGAIALSLILVAVSLLILVVLRDRWLAV
jgi:molybdate transport system permease protein